MDSNQQGTCAHTSMLVIVIITVTVMNNFQRRKKGVLKTS